MAAKKKPKSTPRPQATVAELRRELDSIEYDQKHSRQMLEEVGVGLRRLQGHLNTLATQLRDLHDPSHTGPTPAP